METSEVVMVIFGIDKLFAGGADKEGPVFVENYPADMMRNIWAGPSVDALRELLSKMFLDLNVEASTRHLMVCGDVPQLTEDKLVSVVQVAFEDLFVPWLCFINNNLLLLIKEGVESGVVVTLEGGNLAIVPIVEGEIVLGCVCRCTLPDSSESTAAIIKDVIAKVGYSREQLRFLNIVLAGDGASAEFGFTLETVVRQSGASYWVIHLEKDLASAAWSAATKLVAKSTFGEVGMSRLEYEERGGSVMSQLV